MAIRFPFPLAKSAAALLLIASVGACTAVDPAQVSPDGAFDPYESVNRKTHSFNKGLDRALLRPAGKAYTTIMPDDAETMVSNFANNLGEPSNMVNHLVQGNVEGFGISLYRFVVNTVVGFGGIADVAGDVGVHEDDTDFGETMHVWGVKEGAYLELPVLGPSTERDAVGVVVDMLTDPLSTVLSPAERRAKRGVQVTDLVGQRGRFSDTVDSVLYDSVDSYSQLRLTYLQRRRFELGEGAADTYVDPYSDPYLDPYEDYDAN